MSLAPIIILPLDARPVCYQLPQQLGDIIDVPICTQGATKYPAPRVGGILLPPENKLGKLKQPADLMAIDAWLTEMLALYPESPVILSTDMLLYGGLIPGRVLEFSLEDLQLRLEYWLEKLNASKRKVIAFSTILRIPNYNMDEEEPHYWTEYGQALYQASWQAHQTGNTEAAFAEIPEAIRNDFLARRLLHHQVNNLLIDAFKNKQLHSLTISQDDTGTYGLNVQEAEQYEARCKTEGLNITIQTGADELAATAISRLLCEQLIAPPKIWIHYDPEYAKDTLAKFDGRSIETVIQLQLKASGAILVEDKTSADIILWAHGPLEKMGDHCEQIIKSQTTELSAFIETVNKQPAILVDIANANGGDAEFMYQVIQAKPDYKNLLGYAGWNTPGNSAGSAIAMGVVSFIAQQKEQSKEARYFINPAWQELLLTRLLDDWAYQANCRQVLKTLSTTPDESLLNQQMQRYVSALKNWIPSETNFTFAYPCHRFFEIEVKAIDLLGHRQNVLE